MQQEDEGPNFTLARNFPRTVRWKRRDGDGGGDDGETDVEADEKGEREAAPQVEAAEELGTAVESGREERGKALSKVLLTTLCLLLMQRLQIQSKKPKQCRERKMPNAAVASVTGHLMMPQAYPELAPIGRPRRNKHRQIRSETRINLSICGLSLDSERRGRWESSWG